MHARLTDQEIALLKQLVAAGDKGRTIGASAHQDLARLILEGYVMAQRISPSTLLYVITVAGRNALSRHQERG
jgi:hypothetical protein